MGRKEITFVLFASILGCNCVFHDAMPTVGSYAVFFTVQKGHKIPDGIPGIGGTIAPYDMGIDYDVDGKVESFGID